MVHWMRRLRAWRDERTDNLSILELTIDYGPYGGWVDNFDPAWTPIRPMRRAAATAPAEIARWNLERLAEALGTIADQRLAVGIALRRGL